MLELLRWDDGRDGERDVVRQLCSGPVPGGRRGVGMRSMHGGELLRDGGAVCGDWGVSGRSVLAGRGVCVHGVRGGSVPRGERGDGVRELLVRHVPERLEPGELCELSLGPVSDARGLLGLREMRGRDAFIVDGGSGVNRLRRMRGGEVF